MLQAIAQLVDRDPPTARPDASAAEDAALVARARAGDRAAAALIYQRHARYVGRLATWLSDRREDADDAVQDTFTTALTNLDDLREPFDDARLAAVWQRVEAGLVTPAPVRWLRAALPAAALVAVSAALLSRGQRAPAPSPANHRNAPSSASYSARCPGGVSARRPPRSPRP